MNTIMNKKRIIIISIAVLFLSIGILLSVIFVEKIIRILILYVRETI